MSTPALLRPSRLDALDGTRLLDSAAEPAYDRLTQLAVAALRVPVALVSLVDVNRQFFKSACGLPEPWASRRETGLSHSFCRHVVATGEPLLVEDAREDPRVSENLAVPDLGVIAYAGIPLVTGSGEVLGSFCAIDGAPRTWSAQDVEILRSLAASAMLEIELRGRLLAQERARERLAAEAVEDPLTGLANRRGFSLLAEHSWKLAVSRGWDLVLMYIDLDGFKGINDSCGHAEGDRALRDVAEILTRTFRATDLTARIGTAEHGGLARLGGDEFVVLALDVVAGGEELLVSRLEGEVERLNRTGERPYRVAMSIGTVRVAPATSGSLDEVLAEADRRMYLAKQARGAAR